MKTYKARGIVLHTVRYGENSLVVYLLTDRMGRQTYMAGVRRGRKGGGSRGAMFQPMFPLEFVGVESQKMEMHRFREIFPAQTLATIPFDIRKSAISLFMAEALYRLVREAEPESPLFDFVWDSIKALDSIEEGVSNFHLWFLVRLSSFLGFFPGNEYEDGYWFDIHEGLFTPVRPSHGIVMERDSASLLGNLMMCGADSLSGIKLSGGKRSDFTGAMISYFGYHLNAINQVKSIQVLREVF